MINWTTVFFQIVNFLVVMWILRRYLFIPVMSAMDRRERAVRARLLDADKLKKEAGDERRALESELLGLEGKRAEILADAHAKAEVEQGVLMRSFNVAMQERRDGEAKQMERERAELRKSVDKVAAKALVGAVDSALKELAGSTLQSAMMEKLARRVRRGDFDGASDLRKYYRAAGLILVNASFRMAARERRAVRSALERLVGSAVRLKFGVDERISCGVEIACGPLVVGFGFDDYVARLARDLDDGLAAATHTQAVKRKRA
ncbi:MAG: hypothetical protein LBI17_04195 [Rickettsiales bacterium]|jgi:F-type H+-transporting ATPase subunit b|nr:hypothetical protein [Rickettsiales bacterium]